MSHLFTQNDIFQFFNEFKEYKDDKYAWNGFAVFKDKEFKGFVLVEKDGEGYDLKPAQLVLTIK